MGRAAVAGRSRRRNVESLVHDLADGARAAATLGTAAKAAIDLTGGAGRAFARADHASHVVVGQNIAMTNDHGEPKGLNGPFDKRLAMRKQKENSQF